jgi:hypothetical protein
MFLRPFGAGAWGGDPHGVSLMYILASLRGWGQVEIGCVLSAVSYLGLGTPCGCPYRSVGVMGWWDGVTLLEVVGGGGRWREGVLYNFVKGLTW